MDVHGGAVAHVSGRSLPVITLLDGVFDAGGTVAMMRETLLDGVSSAPLAEFDADLLIDHRATRPRITFHDGSFSDYRAPRLAVDVLTDDLGNSALLFSGAEPLLAWERVAQAFGGLLESVGAGPVSVVHAVPLPVPHTRPVTVRRHGEDNGVPIGPFDLPASFSHLLETRLGEDGHDVGGMTIQVPHYISDSQYPPAAVAGLEAIAARAGLAVPTEELREAGREVDAKIADQIEDNPDAGQLVAGLELRYDTETPRLGQASTLLAEGEAVPDGDELAEAVEAYLRTVDEQGGAEGEGTGDDGDSTPGSTR